MQDFGKVVCSCSTTIYNGYYKTNLRVPNVQSQVNSLGVFPAVMLKYSAQSLSYKGLSILRTTVTLVDPRCTSDCTSENVESGVCQSYS